MTNRFPDVLIRLATLADAEAIRRIYNHEVTTSTATADIEPRSLDEQQAWIAQRSGAHAVLVAEGEGTILGFASLSPYRDRPAYRTTVEDSVYVHQSHQGRGIGRALMLELIDTARDRGFHAMMARIIGDQSASIGLHTAVGFEIVGREKEVGRKFSRWLDVVLMQRLLS